MIVDKRGRFVLVNAQTEKLLGYLRQELIGESLEEPVSTLGDLSCCFGSLSHGRNPTGAGPRASQAVSIRLLDFKATNSHSVIKQTLRGCAIIRRLERYASKRNSSGASQNSHRNLSAHWGNPIVAIVALLTQYGRTGEYGTSALRRLLPRL